MQADTQHPVETIPTHPEEIRGSFSLRIGDNAVLETSIRTTPAGLVTAGLMVSAILLSTAFLVRALRRTD